MEGVSMTVKKHNLLREPERNIWYANSVREIVPKRGI